MMAGEPSPPPNYHLKQTIGSPGAWGDRGFGSFALKDRQGGLGCGERLSSTRSTCGDVELFLAEAVSPETKAGVVRRRRH